MPTHEGPRTVADHLAEVLALVAALPPAAVPLDDALGLVLAEDVTAPEALPRFANSAMDGYAVHSRDVAGASQEHPVTLPVMLDLPAGARAVGFSVVGDSLDAPVSPLGYRLLTKVPRLPSAIVERLVTHFESLQRLLAAGIEDLMLVEGVGEGRARAVREGLSRLAESSILERYV